MSRGLPLVGLLERALYLRSLVLFRDLGATELAACAQLTQERYLRRGEVLYEEASAPRTLYLLVDGRVRLEKGGRFLRHLKATDDAGLVEFLAGQPRGPRAVADSNTLALTIDSAALLDLMEEHFSFFLQIRQGLGREVARRQRELGSYHTLSVPRAGRPATRSDSSNGRGSGPASQSSALQSDSGRVSIDLAEKLLALQRTRLFHDVGLALLAALTSEDREARLAPGKTLWEKDADPAFLALILEGTVACTPQDTRHAFRAGSGTLLGVDATVGGVPYAYTAVAETPVVATCIDTHNFLMLKSKINPQVFSIDNGIAFGGVLYNFFAFHLDRISVPSLPQQSIARLRRVTPDDWRRRAVVEELRVDDAGMLRPVPFTTPLDASDGVRWSKGTLQLGLSSEEIEEVARRTRDLLAEVDQGRAGLF